LIPTSGTKKLKQPWKQDFAERDIFLSGKEGKDMSADASLRATAGIH